MNKFVYVLFALISMALMDLAKGHGRLLKPTSRSSVWRIPQFSAFHPPHNYNDNQLFCGGIHQKDNPGTNCGVCGDPKSQRKPRDNEIGGRYAKDIITGYYKAGQVIGVEVDITAEHKGFMEWRLCTNSDTENQACFNKNLLQVADSPSGVTSVPVYRTGLYRVNLKLPPGVTCDHCILQWNYRAGNNWGQCEDGTGKVGCGPQETFRGCADIKIE